MSMLPKRWKLFAVLGVCLVALSYPLAYYFVSNSDAFAVSSQFLRTNPEVIRVAGPVQDLSLSWSGMQMSVSGGSGRAEFTINIHGASSSPRAYVELQKRGIWEIAYARLLPENQAPVLLKDSSRQ